SLWPLPKLTKALADIRRSSFEAALEQANSVVSGPRVDKPSLAQAWFIQAIAYAHSQRMSEARAALAKGAEIIDDPHIDFVDEFGGGWGLWTIAELLQCEAEAIVQPETNLGPM
ncbi:MAG TPA: hypothetical protein VGJ16_03580, partial [Pirellulales bacterium]